jgi:ABC-type sugar transport system ATPase subunit
MSDRVGIVRDGTILQISSADDLTEYKLLAIASGAEGNQAQ